MSLTKLYRKGEVPKELIGRGLWQQYNGEILFTPFGGTKRPQFDWKCRTCGAEWFWADIKKTYKFHCPSCKEWTGISRQYKQKQVSLEEWKDG